MFLSGLSFDTNTSASLQGTALNAPVATTDGPLSDLLIAVNDLNLDEDVDASTETTESNEVVSEESTSSEDYVSNLGNVEDDLMADGNAPVGCGPRVRHCRPKARCCAPKRHRCHKPKARCCKPKVRRCSPKPKRCCHRPEVRRCAPQVRRCAPQVRRCAPQVRRCAPQVRRCAPAPTVVRHVAPVGCGPAMVRRMPVPVGCGPAVHGHDHYEAVPSNYAGEEASYEAPAMNDQM
ncbi:MAG: hypothetical protein SFU25_02390 [Candidatus Caenarcaniphilales bacterium]|nr:hypothetical protein [Candidatus Caenarcaniphilales bacterium]